MKKRAAQCGGLFGLGAGRGFFRGSQPGHASNGGKKGSGVAVLKRRFERFVKGRLFFLGNGLGGYGLLAFVRGLKFFLIELAEGVFPCKGIFFGHGRNLLMLYLRIKNLPNISLPAEDCKGAAWGRGKGGGASCTSAGKSLFSANTLPKAS